jgi:hypothetical protein
MYSYHWSSGVKASLMTFRECPFGCHKLTSEAKHALRNKRVADDHLSRKCRRQIRSNFFHGYDFSCDIQYFKNSLLLIWRKDSKTATSILNKPKPTII